jgi:hypothetical protein
MLISELFETKAHDKNDLAEVTFNYGIGTSPGKLVKVSKDGRVPHAKLHVNVPKKTALKLGIPHTQLDESITESSGYSFAGSWTKDLVFSKLWAIKELEKIIGQKRIPSVYVLGSWYGNMSVMLDRSNLNIGKIINVDTNKEWLVQSQEVLKNIGIDNTQAMLKDANKLDYRQLPGIVINTSTNDIKNQGWFDNIPLATIVVIQGRNAVDQNAVAEYSHPQELLDEYPLRKVLYQGTMQLQDPETDYIRSMIIGVK